MDKIQKDLAFISADYKEYKGLEDYDFICEDVRLTFSNRYKRYCEDKSITFDKEKFSYANSDSLIILWKNVPDNTKGKVDFNRVFDIICKGKDGFNGILYFSSFNDLTSVYGFEQTIRYLCQLNRVGRKIIFFDDDYFSSGAEKPQTINSNNAETMMTLAIQAISSSNTLEQLERVLPDNKQAPISRFVEFYWDWQRLKEPIDNCKDKLDIYHRTLYKYSDFYEATPYYTEHIKLFPDITEYPVRGALPDKEEFLADRELLQNKKMSVDDFFNKYHLGSRKDADRVAFALEKRKRMTK